jgi:hypothetical protein
LGGAGRALDTGDAFAAGDIFAAGGAFGAGGVLGVNQAAEAGPQTRANAAIREIRTNMKEVEQSDKERLVQIYPAGEGKSM